MYIYIYIHIALCELYTFELSCAILCGSHTHKHPTSGGTDRRLQLELAMCFCWGTVHIAFTSNCRRP